MTYDICTMNLEENSSLLDFCIAAKLWKVSNDPLGRPTVPDGSDHRTCFCTSVPTFQNIAIHNKRRVKITIVTGGTVGLAERIIAAKILKISIFLLPLLMLA